MSVFEEISESLQKGNRNKVVELINWGLAENISPLKLLNDGLLAGMDAIGARWKKNEIFIPEVLIAARAMNAGSALLEDRLLEAGISSIGKVVVGTVKGDLHDIGKNLVGMMLKGKGFEIIDLGVDVDAATFVEAVKTSGARFACMSTLLTTTMPYFKDVVKAFEESGIRDQVTLACGGAPITQEFADECGIDIFSRDAVTASLLMSQIAKKQNS